MLYFGAMELRSSLKFVKLAYVFCILLAVAIGVYLVAVPDHPEGVVWTLLVPAALLFFTIVRHVRRQLYRWTIADGKICAEKGLFSKSTERAELVKVQEVRVHQSFFERVFNVGDLAIETAGTHSWEPIPQVDRPHQAADHILELARAQRGIEGRPGTNAL